MSVPLKEEASTKEEILRAESEMVMTRTTGAKKQSFQIHMIKGNHTDLNLCHLETHGRAGHEVEQTSG